MRRENNALQETRARTESIIESLLRRICEEGDSPEHHRQIDYDAFLQIQLEILKAIIETEESITILKKSSSPENLQIIDSLKERRNLFKLLGSAVAWILLEFNRPYMSTMARGRDPGVMAFKKGLVAEVSALEKFHDPKNERTAILHDITHCLRVGDLTVIDHGEAYPIEIKLVTKKRKLTRRGIRQKRKMKILQEWYYTGKSDKIHPGLTSVKEIVGKLDKHNWREVTEVIKKAEKRGYSTQSAEKCLFYVVFSTESQVSRVVDSLENHLKKQVFTFGCLDKHTQGMPTILPLPNFEIPLKFKLKLLLGEINLCTFLDINSLCDILKEQGFDSIVEKRGDAGPIRVTSPSGKSFMLGYGIIERLLYGCLSLQTVIEYTMHALNMESRISP